MLVRPVGILGKVEVGRIDDDRRLGTNTQGPEPLLGLGRRGGLLLDDGPGTRGFLLSRHERYTL